jgi:hypothetical protein
MAAWIDDVEAFLGGVKECLTNSLSRSGIKLGTQLQCDL